MPTPRETILKGPHDLSKLTGIDRVNNLFDNFVHYLKNKPGFKYETTKKKPEDILDKGMSGDVYCETLVGQRHLAL